MDESYNAQSEGLPSLEPPLRVAITGGTAGLGLALVRAFRDRGAEVAFVARGRERLQRVARELPGTHAIVGDLARKEDIYPIALQVTGSLGGVDVLVNNASSLGPVPLALLADTECEQLELALATNLVGPFRLSRALLGALSASARQGRGQPDRKEFRTVRVRCRFTLNACVAPAPNDPDAAQCRLAGLIANESAHEYEADGPSRIQIEPA